jgi:hypothetical protein
VEASDKSTRFDEPDPRGWSPKSEARSAEQRRDDGCFTASVLALNLYLGFLLTSWPELQATYIEFVGDLIKLVAFRVSFL